MNQVPQHPGLGNPPQASNPYVKPSVGLDMFNARLNGEQEQKLAQAAQAGAAAEKARAETSIINQAYQQSADKLQYEMETRAMAQPQSQGGLGVV